MLHVAPMAKCTHRFTLKLLRQLTRRTTLWTEMVVAEVIIRNAQLVRSRFFPAEDDPNVVLQLASGDAVSDHRQAAFAVIFTHSRSRRHQERLAEAAERALDGFAFREINLNAGCPARSASCGEYGALLLKDPRV